MRKILSYIVLILSIFIIIPTSVSAKTLGQLKSELEATKNAQASVNDKKNQSQNQIKENENSVNQKQQEINTNKQKIEEAIKKIEELKVEIADTKEQIKEVMKTEQISEGTNAYLEYIFGAKSISDFIIRVSMSSQLVDYNKRLIEKYRANIKEQEKLQKELKERQVTLGKQIADLEAQIAKLNVDVSKYAEEGASLSEEIKAQQEAINEYIRIGCKDDQEISSCIGPNDVISATGFKRPINNGTITSEYGWRYHPTLGYSRLHAGIDIGVSEGTPVYPAAAGKVTMIIYRSSCGGNQVFVTHKVGGKQYTTVYMHLLSVNTSVGQSVTTSTVIAYSGGGRSTSSYYGGYDGCTTGAHLHFGIATGWYCVDSSICYTSYSGWTNRSQNPRNYVNFPSLGSSFYGR